jgi:hypothetical protein
MPWGNISSATEMVRAQASAMIGSQWVPPPRHGDPIAVHDDLVAQTLCPFQVGPTTLSTKPASRRGGAGRTRGQQLPGMHMTVAGIGWPRAASCEHRHPLVAPHQPRVLGLHPAHTRLRRLHLRQTAVLLRRRARTASRTATQSTRSNDSPPAASPSPGPPATSARRAPARAIPSILSIS